MSANAEQTASEEALRAAALDVMRRLKAAGHEAWQVGGSVRDRLMGEPLKDIDIATDARPAEIEEIFDEVRLVGASFGVCLVRHRGMTFEVATFRSDGRYIDHRHPESVEFGTLEEDAQRRDFTCNALYYDPETDELRDHAGGEADIRARVIRTVGDPLRRFDEDALRLMRAVRFAARFDFEIEPATRAALEKLAPTIRHVSPERQRDELTAMLTGPAPDRAFRLLDETGLLEIILPEVSAMHGVEQGERWHPEGDVFQHTMLALSKMDLSGDADPVVTAWSVLLHDVGKPATFERRDGKITFYGHERVGADMAVDICHRLRFSNEVTRRISDVVARHMRFMTASEWNRSTMRKFLSADTIHEDLAVHRADCLACHGMLHAWEKVSGELELLEQEEAGPSLPPPLITGHDLIGLGLKPGPKFRDILEAVQERQLEGELKTREDALVWVREREDFEIKG